MLFAGYVDITRRQSFGCLVLTKISQKIDNLIAPVSRYENIGEDGKDVLEVARRSNKNWRYRCAFQHASQLMAGTCGEGKWRRLFRVAYDIKQGEET
jgi:hypothetical protein